MELEHLTYTVAFGSSDDWNIEVMETDGVGLTLVLQHPYLYLQTRIPSYDVVRRLHEMLASPLDSPPEVSLGHILGREVESWIASGRIWFRLGEEDDPSRPRSFLDVRFDVDRERGALLRAVHSALEDLERRSRQPVQSSTS